MRETFVFSGALANGMRVFRSFLLILILCIGVSCGSSSSGSLTGEATENGTTATELEASEPVGIPPGIAKGTIDTWDATTAQVTVSSDSLESLLTPRTETIGTYATISGQLRQENIAAWVPIVVVQDGEIKLETQTDSNGNFTFRTDADSLALEDPFDEPLAIFVKDGVEYSYPVIVTVEERNEIMNSSTFKTHITNNEWGINEQVDISSTENVAYSAQSPTNEEHNAVVGIDMRGGNSAILTDDLTTPLTQIQYDPNSYDFIIGVTQDGLNVRVDADGTTSILSSRALPGRTTKISPDGSFLVTIGAPEGEETPGLAIDSSIPGVSESVIRLDEDIETYVGAWIDNNAIIVFKKYRDDLSNALAGKYRAEIYDVSPITIDQQTGMMSLIPIILFTTSAPIRNPQVSPDGTQFAFVCNELGLSLVGLCLNRYTSSITQLTDTNLPGRVEYPSISWTADGDYILFDVTPAESLDDISTITIFAHELATGINYPLKRGFRVRAHPTLKNLFNYLSYDVFGNMQVSTGNFDHINLVDLGY